MKPDNLFLDGDVLVLGDVGSAEPLATIEAMQAPGSAQQLVDTLAPLFYRPPEVSPSGQQYHWNSNAETYYLIGEAMGRAMLRLMEPVVPVQSP